MSSTSHDLAHPVDIPSDHRPVLNVVTWIIAICTTVVVCGRLATRYAVTKKLGVDDALILVSLVLAVVQTGTLGYAVEHGFGLSQVDGDGKLYQEKAIYAFNILFIVSQCFAKSSVIVFIHHITPVPTHRKICTAILCSIAAWGVVSTFVLLFQCNLPTPWQVEENLCIDRVAAMTFIEIINLLLDASLIMIPTVVIWYLQKQTIWKKVLTIATLSTRILVIIVIISQLVVLRKPHDGDDPILSWTFALTSQLVEYTSIATACAPYLKPFLENLSSGMIRNDDARRRATLSGSRSQQSSDRSYSRFKQTELEKSRKQSKRTSLDIEVGEIEYGHNLADMPTGLEAPRSRDEAESCHSTTNFITRTTTISVTHH